MYVTPRMAFYMQAMVRTCLRAGGTGLSYPSIGQGGLVHCSFRSRTVSREIQFLVCTGFRYPGLGVQSWWEHVCRRIEQTTRGMLQKPLVLPICSYRPGFQSSPVGDKNGHSPCGTSWVLYPRGSSIGLRVLVLGPSTFVDETDDFNPSCWRGG